MPLKSGLIATDTQGPNRSGTATADVVALGRSAEDDSWGEVMKNNKTRANA
jgi:hypothetical protein